MCSTDRRKICRGTEIRRSPFFLFLFLMISPVSFWNNKQLSHVRHIKIPTSLQGYQEKKLSILLYSLSLNSNKIFDQNGGNQIKYRGLTRKTPSHVRFLKYRTWAIAMNEYHCSLSTRYRLNGCPNVFYVHHKLDASRRMTSVRRTCWPPSIRDSVPRDLDRSTWVPFFCAHALKHKHAVRRQTCL